MNFFNGSCRSATIHGIQCVQLFVNTHRTHIVAVHEKSYSIRRTPADFFDYLGLLVDTTLNIVRFANRRNAIGLLSRSNVHRNFRIRISTDRTIRIASVRLRQVNLSIYLSLFFCVFFSILCKTSVRLLGKAQQIASRDRKQLRYRFRFTKLLRELNRFYFLSRFDLVNEFSELISDRFRNCFATFVQI